LMHQVSHWGKKSINLTVFSSDLQDPEVWHIQPSHSGKKCTWWYVL
jgi:hypothetical protein